MSYKHGFAGLQMVAVGLVSAMCFGFFGWLVGQEQTLPEPRPNSCCSKCPCPKDLVKQLECLRKSIEGLREEAKAKDCELQEIVMRHSRRLVEIDNFLVKDDEWDKAVEQYLNRYVANPPVIEE